MIKTDRNRLHYRLREADIRPSMQRLAILEYINSCYCHPTADEVYSELVKEHPTLSRTTVFSSLKLLSEKGLVNNIDISSDSTRYDAADRQPHGHFMCKECRRIFDITLDMSSLRLPDEYVCNNVNVFFKGICPECNQNISTTTK
ncbi:Fur family transcriptional regulator [Paramuribaculum intestinale]|uniref:Fur family transcriptional regulator n=1 Tax=Paramuribaculum intestinale TaxID=2094151 RepID=UPI000F492C27|nr:Fur family transcriptional regulator [Paramuribaculum intestinale]ROT15262.1 transcriptional repressor [Muribaculaceae bacterium Isolate-105 (HZI)]